MRLQRGGEQAIQLRLDTPQAEVVKDTMNADEVAQYVGLCLLSIYKFAKEGKIPAKKSGRNWEFNKQEVDIWKQQREQKKLNQSNHRNLGRNSRRPEGAMSVGEVATYLDISKPYVYKLAKEGKIPCCRTGRYWEFDKREIDLWKQQQALEETTRSEHRAIKGKRLRTEGTMSISEVAEYVGLSYPTVYKLAKQGKIPGEKSGHYWEFDRQEIDAWKQQREIESSLIAHQTFKELTVKSTTPRGYLKEIKFAESEAKLVLPRSACVSNGDRVQLGDSSAAVICKNGLAQIFPCYAVLETLQVGGLELEFLIKEITEPEEFEAYQALAEFHYRSRIPYGRKATLIVRNFHPIYPKIIGYIEIATSFYMNTARKAILDTQFKVDDIAWDRWDKETSRQYIHTIVRISRCVVYPEFRGLGLGQCLLKHAADFARNRWQMSGIKPYFLEISADMLKFVPFAQKAGMSFIGETEGNLKRVAKDMKYLLKNLDRVELGEIVKEESCGILDQQVARMRRAALLIEEQGWTIEELVERLEKLSHETVLRDFNLFHDIVSLPKPTYFQGLTLEAEDFLKRRIEEVAPKNGYISSPLNSEPINNKILLEKVSLTHVSRVRRTQQSHAIHQAFSISPDDISHKIIHNLSLTIEPGEVVLVTGSSGSGKTTFLDLLLNKEKIGLSGSIELPDNYRPGSFSAIRSQRALIEVLSRQDIRSTLHLMGLVGLSDAFVYLKRFEELSNGQQYRAKLAQLIASNYNVWIADEFCSTLDLVTANVVANRLQQIARQLKVVLIVASSQPESFAQALRPDKIIQLTTAWEHHVIPGSQFLESLPTRYSNFTVQSLGIAAKYLPLVRSGQKRSTARKGRLKFKQGLLLLSAKTGDFETVNVTGVRHTRFRCLTEEDAHEDGFTSLSELQKALLEHYPDLSADGWVTIVSFNTSCGKKR
ncbi:GNAT family N-acetyltransferase [Oculatella sp. LEGE 06141]|uniref:GNAT family N-acetyltransferase n=2 Tax=Oculatella sp. LEGE 06141 TaxID=1828648 RepID=UPI0030D8CF4B